jgi:hypothetical protein
MVAESLTKEILNPRSRHRTRHPVAEGEDVSGRLSEAEFEPRFREGEGGIGGLRGRHASGAGCSGLLHVDDWLGPV